jgi:hypothetical protein
MRWAYWTQLSHSIVKGLVEAAISYVAGKVLKSAVHDYRLHSRTTHLEGPEELLGGIEAGQVTDGGLVEGGAFFSYFTSTRAALVPPSIQIENLVTRL